jgi:dihydrolipoamide dehydrogenase
MYDLVIIGSGPGGYVAAIRASQLGLKTAIIEKDKLGGVCLNWGCIPTKSLLNSAQIFSTLKKASFYGIKSENIQINFSSIIERSRSVAEKMSKGINYLMQKNKITVIFGKAELKEGKKIKIITNEGKEMEYKSSFIIIATGASSKTIENLPQDGKKVIGYREALTLSSLPKSMVIVGSGAIGVEFAYFYNAMGVQVSLIESMNRIVPLEDLEISQELEKSFKKNGIKVFTSSYIEKVDISKTGIQILIKDDKKKYKIEADIILSAVGITPNIENLGLGTIGITLEKGHILVDDFYRTNIEGYFAIGDLVYGPSLAHVASAEAIICVDNIKGLNPSPLDYKNIPSCIYCIPEISSVGLSEEKAIKKGYKIKVGKFIFSALGKANANGETEGFIKVIFDANYGEWLGCHMIGKGVTEMIMEAVVARKLETTAHDILNTIHPHPTLSEGVMEAIANAYGKCIHL